MTTSNDRPQSRTGPAPRPAIVATPRRRRRAFPIDLDALERRALLSVAPAAVFPGARPDFGDWSVAYADRSTPFVGPVSPSSPDPGGQPDLPWGDSSPADIALKIASRIDRMGSPPGLSLAFPEPETGDGPAAPGPTSALAVGATPPDPDTIGSLPGLSKVSMAQASYVRDGVSVREFAFADQAKDQVMVRDSGGAGDGEPRVLGSFGDGVRRPDAVAMGDLNGDGVTDLVVANAGADNILIYMGLLGGGFAPELNAGKGIAVGAGPGGVTIGDVNGDGIPDVIVADRASDEVSILTGQGRLGNWSLVAGAKVHVGAAPVFTAVHDMDGDGVVDLLVCNSGSDSVMVLHGLGGGRFDDATPKVLPVGEGPVQFFLGHFDRRPGPELLTVNSGSNDMTLLSGFMGETPTTQTIASGGVDPTSAFAGDLDADGFTDVLVANSGDGRLAYFRGGENGLSLAWVATNPAVPNPTAVVGGDRSADGFDVYTVSAGQDRATPLHFDPNLAGDFEGLAPVTPNLAKGSGADDGQSAAQWVSHGDSTLNLVGILGLPSRRGESGDEEAPEGRYEGAGRIVQARAGLQSLDDDEREGESKPEGDVLPGPDPAGGEEASAWARFVLGIDAGLGDARAVASNAIASPGLFDEEDWSAAEVADIGPGRDPARRSFDPASAVDAAIRSLREEGAAGPGSAPFPAPGDFPNDASNGRVEAIPTISLGLIFAHQLLIRVAPSRRLRPRRARPDPSRDILGAAR